MMMQSLVAEKENRYYDAMKYSDAMKDSDAKKDSDEMNYSDGYQKKGK